MPTPAKLHPAASAGDVKALRALLSAGADVNATDREGYTPLMRATAAAKPAAMRALLEAGADPNRAARDGERALGLAMLYGTPAAVELLLQQGADVRYADANGDTPLMTAYGYGSPRVVELLLAAGADVHARRHDGLTVMDLVQRLFEAGVVEPSASDRKVRQLLLDAGAQATPKPAAPPRPEPHPLVVAAEAGDVRKVRQLLKAGAPVDAAFPEGRTALWYAAGGAPEVVQALLEAGADPNAGGADSILDHAAAWGGRQVVELLLAAGADPKVGLPLHQAAIAATDSLPVARLLLEAGADPKVKDQEGQTAADVARRCGKPALADALIEAGAALSPLAPEDAALEAFAAAAEQPAFRRLLRRLGALCVTPPKLFRGAAHDFRAEAARGVFRCDFVPDRVARHFKHPDAYLREGPRDQRANRQAELLERLQEEVRRAGFLLVRSGDLPRPQSLLLFPTDDPYLVVLAHNTNGNGFYRGKFLGPAEINAWLRTLAKDHPFVLTDCAHDAVGGRFLRPVHDARALAKRMATFCPDLIDGEEIASPAGIAKWLEDTQSFYFWWD